MKRIFQRCAILGFITAMFLAGCGKKEEATIVPPPALPVVLVAEATVDDVPVFKEAIATLDGSTNTEIHAQVSGYLIKQVYQEGAMVKPGDLLFLIDTKPFQTEPVKAPIDSPAPSSAIAPKMMTKVATSVGGVAGRAIPGVGDLIRPGMTLTTISAVDPIAAEFALPEKFYRDHPDQIAQTSFELVLEDGTTYPRKGKFDRVEQQTKSPTGTVTVYALFPNPDRVLRPGQYARIHGATQQTGGVVSVPQRAVNETQGIDQVRVVKPDDTVEIRNVTAGGRTGPLRIITSGLKAGELIVVEGGEKCQAGARVTPQTYVAPSPNQ